MPTYAQTQATVKTSRDMAKTIETGINRSADLTGGYKLKVVFNAVNGQLKTDIIGPKTDLNRIPRQVLINLGVALSKVDRWLNNLEPDFPTL